VHEHRKEIALVLIDLMMPIMAGPAAIHALRKMNSELKSSEQAKTNFC